MSNVITSKSGTVKTVLADPKQCETSNIEGFQRARESWSLDALTELQDSLVRYGQLIPGLAYEEGDKFMVYDGTQRLKLMQAFQANKVKINRLGSEEGEAPMMLLTITKKPKDKADVVRYMLSRLDINNVRYGDDALTLYQTFKMLKEDGLGLVEIGQRCFCSHAKVDYFLRAFGNKATADAVIKGDLDVKAAADITRSKAVQVKDAKTGKTKLDPVKVKEAIKEALEATKATRKPGKPLNIKKLRDTKPESNTRDAGAIKRILKVIVDLPLDTELLSEIVWFSKWLLTNLSTEALSRSAKSKKLDLDGLIDLIKEGAFEPKKKATKKEKAAGKKAASKASKKGNPNIDDDDDEGEELDASDYEE